MASNIHYFGIRHHGPGSSYRLLEALEQLQPDCLLIEGPADCTDLFELLANPKMKTPVAMLSYAVDHTENSSFYPFADFSPEYQACLWAHNNQKSLALIDLPMSMQLAIRQEELEKIKQMELEALAQEEKEAQEQDEQDENFTAEGDPLNDDESHHDEDSAQEDELTQLCLDPLGTLANLAGYQDAESWWNEIIEQNQDNDLDIFTYIEEAMTELRAPLNDDLPVLARDLQREAFMRLEIAKHAKEVEGTIAVICGAWHVPALKEKHTAKHDRELLKPLPKKLTDAKYKSTFVPWTSPRLASKLGYGAGVDSPMWYQHLWEQKNKGDFVSSWLVVIAHMMRQEGMVISTASVIEAQRLSHTLATLRNRISPSFEDIKDAAISCLCFGEEVLWQQIESHLLLGNQVGEIADDLELIPLLEELQQLQKKYKLKPEALEKEHSLDLRSEIGQNKSTLLHRLTLLGIDWGVQTSTGSRGTFREKWILQWRPEHAIALVDCLVYGNTIELAANNKAIESFLETTQLAKLAELVHDCLQADLEKATKIGLEQLSKRAGKVSDCRDLLNSISPLVTLLRYGTARKLPLDKIADLIERLMTQSALALPYACRNLNEDESEDYKKRISEAHNALLLHFENSPKLDVWWQAIEALSQSTQTSFLLIGVTTNLLYQDEKISADELNLRLTKMLSPIYPSAQSAQFFDGFFSGMADHLLYDKMLLSAVNTWLLHLEEQDFIEFLPLFRRVLSDLDSMERKHLLDNLLHSKTSNDIHFILDDSYQYQWQEQQVSLIKLLQGNKEWR